MRKYNRQFSNPEDNSASREDASSPSDSFPPGTRYPPSLPESLAVAFKPRPLPVAASSKKKNTTARPKSPPSAKDVEKALSRLPPLLPKFDNQNVEPVQNGSSGPKKQKVRCKPAKSAGKTRVAAKKVTRSSEQNQGKLIITLPAAPLASGGETRLTVPSVATMGASPGNVIMTLPTALICPTPSATLVAQTPPSFTPLPVKEHMSPRCDMLLKLSMRPKPDPSPLSVSSQFFLLPAGCVVTNNPHVKPHHSENSRVAQEDLEGSSLGSLSENSTVSWATSEVMSGVEGNEVQESDDMEAKVYEEDVECGDEDFREPFLTLSESSGSPASSVCGDADADDAMETVTDREVEDVEERRQRESQTSPSARWYEGDWTEGENDGKRERPGMQEEKKRSITSPASVTSELCLLKLQVRSSVLQPFREVNPDINMISRVGLGFFSSSHFQRR